MYEREERELTFNLPDELASGLTELGIVDDMFPNPTVNPDSYNSADVAQFVADAYTAEAVREYIRMRKSAPEFPAQLAEAKARLNRQMDEEIFRGNPSMN